MTPPDAFQDWIRAQRRRDDETPLPLSLPAPARLPRLLWGAALLAAAARIAATVAFLFAS